MEHTHYALSKRKTEVGEIAERIVLCMQEV